MALDVDFKVINVVLTGRIANRLNLEALRSIFPSAEDYLDGRGIRIRLRKPKKVHISFFDSGRINITGASSVHHAMQAAYSIIKRLRRAGIVLFRHPELRIVNIVAEADFHGQVDFYRAIEVLSQHDGIENVIYVPEQHPSLRIRIAYDTGHKVRRTTIILFANGKCILPGFTDPEEALAIARKLRAILIQEGLLELEELDPIQVEFPSPMYRALEELVKQGRYPDIHTAVLAAIRSLVQQR